MRTFLICWLASGASLAITLVLLDRVYDARDGDLGLGGWRREAVIAAVISLLQAVIYWASVTLIGGFHGRMLMVAGVVSYLAYKLTHIPGGILKEDYEMDDWCAGAIAVTQIGLVICCSLLFRVLTSLQK